MSRPEDTDLRTDRSTGRPVLVAPGRRARPLHTVAGKDDAGQCPFCPGAESETPPEADSIRHDSSKPDTPGWTARAFPNKYPAAEHHEVLVEGAQHRSGPEGLSHADWVDSLTLLRRRLTALESRPGVRCAFWFKNVGREAGASVAHNHSQMLGLPILPPRLELEWQIQQREPSILLDDLERARSEGRIVFEGSSHSFLSPTQSKLPYETWIVPHDRSCRFEEADLDDLAHTMRTATAALGRALNRPPFNLYLHRVPDSDFHWHFEMQPRNGYLAALELGGDMYINSVRPADASALLREHLPQEASAANDARSGLDTESR